MPFHIIISENHTSGLSARIVLELLKISEGKNFLKNIKLCVEYICKNSTKTNLQEIFAKNAGIAFIIKQLESHAKNRKSYEQIDSWFEVISHMSGLQFTPVQRHVYIYRYFLLFKNRYLAYNELCDYCTKSKIEIFSIDIMPEGATDDTYSTEEKYIQLRSGHMEKKLQEYDQKGISTISVVGTRHLTDLHKMLPKTMDSYFFPIKDIGYLPNIQWEDYHGSISKEYQKEYESDLKSFKENYFQSAQPYLNTHPEIEIIETSDPTQAIDLILQKLPRSVSSNFKNSVSPSNSNNASSLGLSTSEKFGSKMREEAESADAIQLSVMQNRHSDLEEAGKKRDLSSQERQELNTLRENIERIASKTEKWTTLASSLTPSDSNNNNNIGSGLSGSILEAAEYQSPIQRLLHRGHILPPSSPRLVRIEFNVLQDAKDFVAELLKIGFGNRTVPSEAKKIEPLLAPDPNNNNNSNTQVRYIVELTADEWDALQQNEQAFAKAENRTALNIGSTTTSTTTTASSNVNDNNQPTKSSSYRVAELLSSPDSPILSSNIIIITQLNKIIENVSKKQWKYNEPRNSFSLKTEVKDSANNIKKYLSDKGIGSVKIVGGNRVVISNITAESLTSIAPIMSSPTNTNIVASSTSLSSSGEDTNQLKLG